MAADLGQTPTLGSRSTPAYSPTPNNVPVGANTGAPPRTRFYSRQVIPSSAVGGRDEPTKIVEGTSENRSVTLLAPVNSGTVYIGDAGVTPATGFALPEGLAFVAFLVGLQDLYAVTDSPTYTQIQVQVAVILAAEQARPVR